MANKVIAIEIGNSITRIVQMDYMTRNPKIYRHIAIPTPEGTINDGYVNNDVTTLADAIKQAIADEKMNASKNVIFTIASNKILTREVMLPAVKTNMIDSTVRMNLTEYFPIDLSAHEVSNLRLETIKEGENAGKHRVLIVAAEKELIKTYEELAKNIGLVLLQVDYVGNSIYECFKNEESLRCNMILKVEENQTSITIVDHKNLLLQRNISYGFEEVIQEVASKPAFGVKSYEEAAEYIKHNVSILENLADTASSLSADAPSENRSGSALLEAKASVTRAMSGFINAVSRVVDFYNSKYSVPIDRIYVCGLGGDFTGINTLLTNEMGIKTHILKKLDEIQWIATTDVSGFHCYAATIGAGIAPIGLYSKAREDKAKRATNFKMLSLLVAVLTIVIMGAMFLPTFMERKMLEDEHRSLVSLEQSYIEAEGIYHKYESVLDFYKSVYMGSLLLESPNDSILLFFDQLEKILPSDSSIQSFSSNSEQVVMTIRVKDDATAAALINEIRGFSSLVNVSVSSINESWYDNTETPDADTNAADVNAVEENVAETAEAGDENAEGNEGNASINRVLAFVEFTITADYGISEFDALGQMSE